MNNWGLIGLKHNVLTFYHKLLNNKLLLAMVILLLLTISTTCQADWDLQYQGDDIAVYSTQPKDSEFIMVKGSIIIDVNINSFYQLLTNETLAPTWLDRVNSTKLIKQISDSQYVVQTFFAGAGLVQSREMLTLSTVIEKNEQRLEMTAIDHNDFLPVNAQFIRVEKVNVRWLAQAINETQIQVTYLGSFDPAGSLPIWLSNKLAVSSLVTSFKNLKQITSSSKDE